MLNTCISDSYLFFIGSFTNAQLAKFHNLNSRFVKDQRVAKKIHLI